jgi:hypothetical protein
MVMMRKTEYVVRCVEKRVWDEYDGDDNEDEKDG